MADFIGRATQLLNHEVPGFLEMDHVLGPPINFRDAMMRAQQGTLADIDRLMSRVGIGAIVRAIQRNVKISFTYLLLQLHVRLTNKQWREIEPQHMRAYLTFAVLDQYTDILSKVRADGFNARVVLEDLCSQRTIDALRGTFSALAFQISAQRSGRGAEYRPTDVDCQAVMARYAAFEQNKALARLWANMAVGAVAVFAVGWWLRRAL